jgi:hypothetical protein
MLTATLISAATHRRRLLKYSGTHVKIRRLSLLLCLFLLLSSLAFSASAAAPQAETITIKLQTPAYHITPGNDGFDGVQIEGFDLSTAPGDPALPGKIYDVALPPDVAGESISVELLNAKSVELPGTYRIAPAPPAVTWVDGREIIAWGENASSIIDGQNTKVYQNDAFFPASHLTPVAQSQMRKWRFVRLLFMPMQYNPVTGKLRLTTEGEARVTFERKPAIQAQQIQTELSDTVMDREAARILYNYDQAQAWYHLDTPPMSLSTEASYVIITTNQIVAASSQLANFVAHQQAKGNTVEVVTETQYGGLVGQSPNGTAEKIRQWLKNNYQAKHIQYVLLIGNPDPDDPSTAGDSVGDVPMKMCWPRRDAGDEYKEAPTDYFYADLTGNWDLDGDGYFGEYAGDRGTGGVDYAPEVYVGRIPVYTGAAGWADALDGILQKTMDYEISADVAWRKSALLPMSFSDSSTDGAALGESMKSGYLNAKGYTSYTLYQHKTSGCASGSTSNESLVGGAVRTRWQNSDYGVVTWWGHGNETGAYVGYGSTCSDGSILTSADAGVLDDSHPAIVYQCSCLNGYPETGANLGYTLLKRGAVATVSASRVSWYRVGAWSPSRSIDDNASIGYYFMQQLVSNQDPAGKALYDQKGQMGSGSQAAWMNLMDFNLYGDPSISLSSGATGCPDAYEADDDASSAKWLTAGSGVQARNFHIAGDVDWAKLSVTAGTAYTITTTGLGVNNDTLLELYGTDGTSLLASNDNCGVGPASCINNWTATGSGTYFVRVRQAANQGGCAGYSYNLSAVSDHSTRSANIFLPVIVNSGSPCNTTRLVQNGGFESGEANWVQPSGYYSIVGSSDDGYLVHSGLWGTWFGGGNNFDDRLYQAINVPAGASSARLAIYLFIASDDYPSDRYDYFHVELQNSSGGTLESFLWADNTLSGSSWYVGTKEWSDFRAHAGQARRLFFQGTTDVSLVTSFFMDDVTLQAYCGALPPGGSQGTQAGGWNWQKLEAPPGFSPGGAPLYRRQ